MMRATELEVYDGLRVSSLAGKGWLPDEPDEARHDKTFVHADVVVAGGGPAGLMAALAAGTSGARVLLIDEQPRLGGRLLATRSTVDGARGSSWVESTRQRLAALPEVRVLSRTIVVGYNDHNYLVAVERRADHLGRSAAASRAARRLWHVRAGQVVLATGAHERSIAFPDNDRPGIMLACSAATYAWRYGCPPGRRAVVFGAHDGALAAAVDLADAGIEVAAVLDVRHAVGRSLAAALAERGIVVRTGTAVRGTLGDETGVLRAVQTSTGESIEADLLAVSGGWNPAVELFSQSGGRTVWSEEVAGFVPDVPAQPTHTAGAGAGAVDLVDALRTGAQAGVESARAAGFEAAAPDLPPVEGMRLGEVSPAAFFLVATSAGESDRVFVDLQRDATVCDVQRAVSAGLTSVEHIKRYTTIGTAADQGRGSGVLAVGVLAQLSGRSVAEIGTTTYRPPYSPISFAVLAGRDRGRLADPERVTAIHDWHVEHGAVFEDVGQWKRPWFFPQPGETMDEAVRRECIAARTGVAMMDASTLGTIELQGEDVGVLLDRLYTNLFSTLRVGHVRYGVMCGPDGMVLDDGTTARLAEDRWLMSTTTGNATKILEWLEEWRQTEWPSLDVRATSVTDNWSTIALVGPRARDVLARLAPELDCSVEGFPFMTIRYAEVGGIPARIMRVSFSGELAYEINVFSWYAVAAWKAVHAAGQPFGITPYGTETMHVLRAEKGYPIVGQDTDGTVTPQDLGMSWIVSKKKPDFVGKRSFVRPDTSRDDRPQLVGLVPVDGRSRVVEGAQLVPHGANLRKTPVPMYGHVTSSYDSVALGTPFALALLDSGSSRHGEVLDAVNDGVPTPVRVGSPIPYDPAGERRNG